MFLTQYDKDLLRWLLKVLKRLENTAAIIGAEDRVEKLKRVQGVISKLL